MARECQRDPCWQCNMMMMMMICGILAAHFWCHCSDLTIPWISSAVGILSIFSLFVIYNFDSANVLLTVYWIITENIIHCCLIFSVIFSRTVFGPTPLSLRLSNKGLVWSASHKSGYMMKLTPLTNCGPGARL